MNENNQSLNCWEKIKTGRRNGCLFVQGLISKIVLGHWNQGMLKWVLYIICYASTKYRTFLLLDVSGGGSSRV